MYVHKKGEKMVIQRISVDVNDEMYRQKLDLGVKWSWLIEQGFKAKERGDRIDSMRKLLEEQSAKIIMLENDVKLANERLNSWARGGKNVLE